MCMKRYPLVLKIFLCICISLLFFSCMSFRDDGTISFEAKLKKIRQIENHGVGRNTEYSAYAGGKNVRERKTVAFSLKPEEEITFIAFIVENDTHPDKGRGEIRIPVSDFSSRETKTVRVSVEVTENDPPKKGKKAVWEFVFEVTRGK